MSNIEDLKRLADALSTKGESFDYKDPETKKSLDSLIKGWAFWDGGNGVRRVLFSITYVVIGLIAGIPLGIFSLWVRSSSRAYIEAYSYGVLTMVALFIVYKILLAALKKLRR